MHNQTSPAPARRRQRTAGRPRRWWLGIAIVVALFLVPVLFLSQTDRCGPVRRDVADKRAAIVRGDTVPAAEQNGDTTAYRFECVRRWGGGR